MADRRGLVPLVLVLNRARSSWPLSTPVRLAMFDPNDENSVAASPKIWLSVAPAAPAPGFFRPLIVSCSWIAFDA